MLISTYLNIKIDSIEIVNFVWNFDWLKTVILPKMWIFAKMWYENDLDRFGALGLISQEADCLIMVDPGVV